MNTEIVDTYQQFDYNKTQIRNKIVIHEMILTYFDKNSDSQVYLTDICYKHPGIFAFISP